MDAAARALECFDKRVILIMGGRSKKSDFRLLEDRIRRHTKKLIVMGEARDEIVSALGHLTSTASVISMEDAVMHARQAAVPGDVVLLSPACSSFDMYGSYAERGKHFCETVKKMKRKVR